MARRRAELAAAVDSHLGWLRGGRGRGRRGGRRRGGAAAVMARHRQGVAEPRERAEALRRRIVNFNLTVPVVGRQVMNINPDRVVAEVEAAAAPLLAALGGGGRA